MRDAARLAACTNLFLLLALVGLLAAGGLSRQSSPALHAALDVPMFLSFWAYLLLTPLVSLVALWPGRPPGRLKRLNRSLLLLWIFALAVLLAMPVATL